MNILLNAPLARFESALDRSDAAQIGEWFRELLVASQTNDLAVHKVKSIEKCWSKGLESLPAHAPKAERHSPDPGMLAAVGYDVRGELPIPEDKRRLLLDYILTSDVLPPIKDWFYMDQWGRAKSIQRGGKLIRVLEKLAESNSPRDFRFKKAIPRWAKDIDFVRARCAELGIKLTFTKEEAIQILGFDPWSK